ncbi:hypothetical protein EV702DRAFT_1044490 [Suillus placidus]|uniref:Uncharacterized protein n=1 Tax=Suillus placidus TaxID=48579 RepID=A0A9P6ZXI8_9AGAM|nr:hypothetical protein EV702DRAFT_1044490 [Suillus placidus]
MVQDTYKHVSNFKRLKKVIRTMHASAMDRTKGEIEAQEMEDLYTSNVSESEDKRGKDNRGKDNGGKDTGQRSTTTHSSTKSFVTIIAADPIIIPVPTIIPPTVLATTFPSAFPITISTAISPTIPAAIPKHGNFRFIDIDFDPATRCMRQDDHGHRQQYSRNVAVIGDRLAQPVPHSNDPDKKLLSQKYHSALYQCHSGGSARRVSGPLGSPAVSPAPASPSSAEEAEVVQPDVHSPCCLICRDGAEGGLDPVQYWLLLQSSSFTSFEASFAELKAHLKHGGCILAFFSDHSEEDSGWLFAGKEKGSFVTMSILQVLSTVLGLYSGILKATTMIFLVCGLVVAHVKPFCSWIRTGSHDGHLIDRITKQFNNLWIKEMTFSTYCLPKLIETPFEEHFRLIKLSFVSTFGGLLDIKAEESLVELDMMTGPKLLEALNDDGDAADLVLQSTRAEILEEFDIDPQLLSMPGAPVSESLSHSPVLTTPLLHPPHSATTIPTADLEEVATSTSPAITRMDAQPHATKKCNLILRVLWLLMSTAAVHHVMNKVKWNSFPTVAANLAAVSPWAVHRVTEHVARGGIVSANNEDEKMADEEWNQQQQSMEEVLDDQENYVEQLQNDEIKINSDNFGNLIPKAGQVMNYLHQDEKINNICVGLCDTGTQGEKSEKEEEIEPIDMDDIDEHDDNDADHSCWYEDELEENMSDNGLDNNMDVNESPIMPAETSLPLLIEDILQFSSKERPFREVQTGHYESQTHTLHVIWQENLFITVPMGVDKQLVH